MSDEKPDGPQYISTKQIPKVEVSGNTIEAILSEVRAMRGEGQETRDQVANLATNVEVLTQHVDTLTSRVILVERRQDEADGRGSKFSGGIRQLNDTDTKHESELAKVNARLDAVETNQAKAAEERAQTAAYVKEVRDTVVGVATNKKVIFIGKVLFAAAVAYSGLHGLKVLP